MTTALWQPKNPKTTRLWKFMHRLELSYSITLKDYQALHTWSVAHPKEFWSSLADFFGITFATEPTEILNEYQHPLEARWFSGATFNFAEQLLRRFDEHPALVSINERGIRSVLSYQALNQVVAACAEGLKEAGVQPLDRVGAVMPNVDLTIIAMLATASLGAIWSSCSSDFGAEAVIDRLGQIEPKVLFIANGHEYAGKRYDACDKILALANAIPSLKKIVICPIIDSDFSALTAVASIPSSIESSASIEFPAKAGIQVRSEISGPHGRCRGDSMGATTTKPDLSLSTLSKVLTWKNFLKPRDRCDFNHLPFETPLYILFSSGTTGKPKCIVHGAGGTLLQHLKELGLHSNMDESDNLCFYTTCGWMMWNWMVSTLALGATLTLYEGSPTYPTPLRLFQLLDEEKVTVFGTSAKFIASIEKQSENPAASFSLTHLKTILSTGSPLLPHQYDFVYKHIKADVQLASISGGTDIVSCFALGNPLLPVYSGELQCLGLGMAVNVFNEDSKAVIGERGELVCTNAFPSMPIYFWNDPDKKAYFQAYFARFPGVWTHGDFAEITPHHGLIIYGRSDTVLNPGGVRIGTAEIYRQVEKVPQVIESVVIGQAWKDDVRVILFVKLPEGLTLDETLKKTISLTIRHNASPRHVPAIILQVPDVPRTMNGKVVELAVRQVVHGQTVTNLASLANPEALAYFTNRPELSELDK